MGIEPHNPRGIPCSRYKKNRIAMFFSSPRRSEGSWVLLESTMPSSAVRSPLSDFLLILTSMRVGQAMNIQARATSTRRSARGFSRLEASPLVTAYRGTRRDVGQRRRRASGRLTLVGSSLTTRSPRIHNLARARNCDSRNERVTARDGQTRSSALPLTSTSRRRGRAGNEVKSRTRTRTPYVVALPRCPLLGHVSYTLFFFPPRATSRARGRRTQGHFAPDATISGGRY